MRIPARLRPLPHTKDKTTMQALIDWYSFSMPVPEQVLVTGLPFGRLIKHVIDRSLGRDLSLLLFPPVDSQGGDTWESTRGRFPYSHAIINKATRTIAYTGEGQSHILVEMSGTSCAHHYKREELLDVISATHTTCTRIDVSADIQCNVTPQAFVGEMDAQRFRSTSDNKSVTGDCVYIGSTQSPRRCAVYRYAAPHYRSHLLRVEHRHRAEVAKIVAGYLVKFGLEKTLIACAHPYKWSHPCWDTNGLSVEPLPSTSYTKHGQDKVHWLLNQVFPAMRKYEREGIIPDLRQFLEKYLYENEGGFDSDN